MNIFRAIYSRARSKMVLRTVTLVFGYIVILSICFTASYALRFDFNIPSEINNERLRLMWFAVGVKLMWLFAFRQTGSIQRYFGVQDFTRIAAASLCASIMLFAPRILEWPSYILPRGVLLIDSILAIAGLCAFRLAIRLYQQRFNPNSIRVRRKMEKIIIVGAGDTGASLANDLLNSPSRGLRPVAFVDDDVSKIGRLVHGVPVIGRPEELVSASLAGDVRHTVVAMPSASPKRVKEILLLLGEGGYQVEILPAVEDVATGRAKISRIRPVEVDDLLGRESVKLDTKMISQMIAGRIVMVTGAGGSIGSELCRQVAALGPQRLLMLDQSEPSLFLIEQELNEIGMGSVILPIVADITDTDRIASVFERHGPDVVFHAAAHKHVYLMERQPAEAIKNNSVGTRLLAEVAARYGVKKFVLVSTDKAINPTNVMGASKRLAEIHLQALHLNQIARRNSAATVAASSVAGTNGNKDGSLLIQNLPPTEFVAVRFGNVLGSSGSVVPIFKKQIAAGGPVTVTHPDVTRYFMTIPEAVGLVLQSATLGKGGDIFVLDMGPPVRISDLAKQMIELSGFQAGVDIEIKYVGLKPGEKLYEELRHHDESHLPTEHTRIMRFVSSGDPVIASQAAIATIEPILYKLDNNEIKKQLVRIIPEYRPFFD